MGYIIIYEDNEILVINKPAGLLVHGAPHLKEKSLIEDLAKKYPEIRKVGDDPHRPGIVHRIDKNVAGLLIITKSQKAFEFIKEQFQSRRIKKYYSALAYGRVEKDEGRINFPIARSAKGHKMAAPPYTKSGEKNEEGRSAATDFWVKRRFINYTLLKIKIKTGRTHQIRVHLAAYGYPIVGDDLYGTKKTKQKNEKLREKGLIKEQIMLVASELEFIDLEGKPMKFKINLPDYFEKFIKNLSKK